MPLAPIFTPCDFDTLSGWADDDHALAFSAFRRCAILSSARKYKTGSLGVDHVSFAEAYGAAIDAGELEASEARRFFELYFVPCRMSAEDDDPGFVTSYYEPIASASPTKTESHRYPIYRRPADLVDIDDDNRPDGMDSYFAFGRQTSHGPTEYFDRAAIEQGALHGHGLEIAWLSDPVEVFFIHVQGAARLRFPDDTETRITYAAKSGHRFSGPGGVLASIGEIERPAVTMQSIKAWFAANPHRTNEILWQNRSFIFFREAAVNDPLLGPVAAAKVPLTAGRSIAVDRQMHTFGTPIFVNAPELTRFDEQPFARLMIAQDTGSAITGPVRGDLFAGSGDAAGEIAGGVKHNADFFALIPHDLISGTNQ